MATNNIYDCIIVGAGPAGLTFATIAEKNSKILIIDKDKVIGGCHKVNRQKYENENYFSEHGPRLYFNNYTNFKTILNIIGVKFNDIFIKYKISLIEIMYNLIIKDNIFTFNEIMKMTKDFLLLMINPNYAKEISMKEYLNINKFSDKAINYVDRYCRFMDGGDSNMISLHTFLNVMNEVMLYNIYQPKKPNDEGLFIIWYHYLKTKNIKFKLNTIITSISETNNIVKIITLNNEIIYTKRLILAIPPINLNTIINNSDKNIKNKFTDLQIYAENTEYNQYISITFHWNFKLNIDDKLYGFYSNTDWGIGAIVLSDYMKFKEKNSKTVISCVITIIDKKSKIINKTANECIEKNELIMETFRQLREIYKDLPIPTLAFINNYYENKHWNSNETAFIKTPHYKYLSNKISDNIYTLGTHNGNARVHFTSMESAITNAIVLSNELYNTGYHIKRPFNIRDILVVIIIMIIIIILINLYIGEYAGK
jgi:protoporphyrinogen oxidase